MRAIIGLAKAFELEVVAEGVETLIAAETLMGVGCMRAQGFLLSRPINDDAMQQLLTNPYLPYLPFALELTAIGCRTLRLYRQIEREIEQQCGQLHPGSHVDLEVVLGQIGHIRKLHGDERRSDALDLPVLRHHVPNLDVRSQVRHRGRGSPAARASVVKTSM